MGDDQGSRKRLAVKLPSSSLNKRVADGGIHDAAYQPNPTDTGLPHYYFSSDHKRRRSNLSAPRGDIASETKAGLYQPLTSADSIRLLVILPGAEDETVKCRLQPVRLSDNVAYEAVSYVWGDITKLAEIQCDGFPIPVSRNLCHALGRFRLPKEPRTVWIDGVCIDQSNLDERGHQVKLMSSIFQKANRVLVWLGHPKEEKVARRAFQSICDLASAELSTVGYDDGPPVFMNSEGSSYLHSQFRSSSSAWRSLAKFFDLPWFWRLWVIQEIALSSAATVFWGKYSMSWKWVGVAAFRIRHYHYRALQDRNMDGVHNACLMYSIWIGDRYSEPVRASFLRLLGLTRQFGTSDSRDRVYSLLGLPASPSRISSHEGSEKGLFVDPNYNLSVGEVYAQVARKILEQDESLRLLSSVQHGAALDPEIPSWIPQWEQVFTHMLASSDPLSTTSASAGLEHCIADVDENNILTVQGLDVGSVAAISFTMDDKCVLSFSRLASHMKLPEHNKHGLAGILEDMLSAMRHSGSVEWKTLAWTLTAGRNWAGDYVPITHASGDSSTENEIEARQHYADSIAYIAPSLEDTPEGEQLLASLWDDVLPPLPEEKQLPEQLKQSQTPTATPKPTTTHTEDQPDQPQRDASTATSTNPVRAPSATPETDTRPPRRRGSTPLRHPSSKEEEREQKIELVAAAAATKPRSSSSPSPSSSSPPPAEDRLPPLPLLLHPDAARFAEAARAACSGRRLFAMSSSPGTAAAANTAASAPSSSSGQGRGNRRVLLLGLGPAAMREGDCVCVLGGGTVPFVLRREEGRVTGKGEKGEEGGGEWRLVGECYVQELMESGLAAERWRKEELGMREFRVW